MITKPREPDPVEYLIYRKYPIFYTLKVQAQHNAPIPEEWREDVEKINAYNAELQAKPAAEILTLYNQAREEEEQKRQTCEEEKHQVEATRKQQEQDALSKAINASVDYELWAKMPIWSLEEAVALSLNLSPNEFRHQRIRNYQGAIQLIRDFVKLTELVARAKTVRQLTDPIYPSKFLAWVKRNDISFPEELEKEINRIHGTPINWEAKHEELQNKYDSLALSTTFAKSIADKKIVWLESENAELQASLAKDAQPSTKPKDLSIKERETLLKIIIGMAVDGYGYDIRTAKSPTPQEICDALAERGISLDVDTIRNKLKEGAQFLSGEDDAAKPNSVISKPKSAKSG